MKKTLTLIFAVLLTLGMMTVATAQEEVEEEDSSDVEVQISEETAVDLDPDILEFIDEGPVPGSFLEQSDGDHEYLQIENVGSTNIERVWMDASYPESNPFATGEDTSYDAANFMTINIDDVAANSDNLETEDFAETGENEWVYINRVDFEEPTELQYVFVEDDDEWAYGRFRGESDNTEERDSDEEYFWAVETEGDDLTGNEFRVGEVAHTQDTTGTSDFTDGEGDYTDHSLSDTGETVELDDETYNMYQVETDEEVSVGDSDYGVLVLEGETNGEIATVRTQHNTDFEGVDLSGNDAVNYIFDDEAEGLYPGDSFAVNIGLSVPRGVAQGDMDSGTLTVNVVATEEEE